MLLCFEIMFMNWILLDQNRGVAGNGRAHSLSVRANTNIQCVPLKGTPGWKEQEPIERRAKTALRRQSPDTKEGKVVPAQCRSQFPKISVSRAAKQRRALPQPMYFPQFCRKLEKNRRSTQSILSDRGNGTGQKPFITGWLIWNIEGQSTNRYQGSPCVALNASFFWTFQYCRTLIFCGLALNLS